MQRRFWTPLALAALVTTLGLTACTSQGDVDAAVPPAATQSAAIVPAQIVPTMCVNESLDIVSAPQTIRGSQGVNLKGTYCLLDREQVWLFAQDPAQRLHNVSAVRDKSVPVITASLKDNGEWSYRTGPIGLEGDQNVVYQLLFVAGDSDECGNALQSMLKQDGLPSRDMLPKSCFVLSILKVTSAW